MSATGVRRAAMAVFFLVGIPGMILASIADRTGAAVTLGLVAAGAAVVLISVTAVQTGRIPPDATAATSDGPAGAAEAEAQALEGRIAALVADGAEETTVRDLVRAAVRLGVGRASPSDRQT